MRRTWWACRVCGSNHKNPLSSSICEPCGKAESQERQDREREERETYERSPFGQFMSLSEEERWKILFDKFLKENPL